MAEPATRTFAELGAELAAHSSRRTANERLTSALKKYALSQTSRRRQADAAALILRIARSPAGLTVTTAREPTMERDELFAKLGHTLDSAGQDSSGAELAAAMISGAEAATVVPPGPTETGQTGPAPTCPKDARYATFLEATVDALRAAATGGRSPGHQAAIDEVATHCVDLVDDACNGLPDESREALVALIAAAVYISAAQASESETLRAHVVAMAQAMADAAELIERPTPDGKKAAPSTAGPADSGPDCSA